MKDGTNLLDTLASFTTYVAEGSVATNFTTDGAAASVTFTGNDTAGSTTNDTLTLSGASGLSLTGIGAGTYSGTSFSHIDGQVNVGTGNVVTLSVASSLSLAGTTATFTVSSNNQTLSGFKSFTAGGSFAVAFTTDGTAAEGFAGNDTVSTQPHLALVQHRLLGGGEPRREPEPGTPNTVSVGGSSNVSFYGIGGLLTGGIGKQHRHPSERPYGLLDSGSPFRAAPSSSPTTRRRRCLPTSTQPRGSSPPMTCRARAPRQ